MALADILQQIKTAFIASGILQQAYGFDKHKSFDDQFSELSLEAADISLFANVQANMESILTADQSALQTLIDRHHIGTGAWYVEIAKQFQWSEDDSYHLTVDPDTGAIGYNSVVPEHRIITQAACTETDGRVIIKIASGTPGNLHPLTDMQRLNFENYLRQRKVAGIKVEVVNLPADELEIDCNIYYSPAYNVEQLQEAIVAGLDRYSAATTYNGIIYRNAVIDTIQRVPGVVDVQINSLCGIQGDRTAIDRAYTTYSGYFNLKKTDGFPKITLTAE